MKVRMYPNEFLGLVNFLHGRVTLSTALLPLERSIYDQILLEYWQKAKLVDKVPAWRHRSGRQRYTLEMPFSVARILHQEMQHTELTVYGQSFLARLDQHLVNTGQ